MKNSPRPVFIFHQTLQLALCIRAGSVFLASANPRFVWVKWDSSLQTTRFHCYRVQWRRTLHHSSRRLALHMMILGLCAAAWPLKPISWSSWRTVIVLTLLPEAVWNSVMSVATEDRRFLRASAHGGPVLWACVAYHFVDEPLLLLDVSTSQ